jgi:arylsulfate sulfotransferase
MLKPIWMLVLIGAVGLGGCSSESTRPGADDAGGTGGSAGSSGSGGLGGAVGGMSGAGTAGAATAGISGAVAAGAGTAGTGGAPVSAAGTATLKLNPNGSTPLAAELRVVFSGHATLDVSIQGAESWSLSSEGTDGVNLPVLGFKPGREYQVTVTLTTGAETLVLGPLELVTAPLPSDFPALELLSSAPERMAPGHTLFSTTGDVGYLVVVDERGEVVWYHPLDGLGDARKLANGNLLFLDGASSESGEAIVEMTFLGHEVRRLARVGALGGPLGGFNHEVFPARNGNFYSLEASALQIEGFRTDYEDATLHGTVEVFDCLLVEVDAAGNPLRKKGLLDILDRERVSYDSLDPTPPFGDYQNDWIHANAIVPVNDDSSFIISARNQDAVFKLSQDWSQLHWLLANHTGWSEPFRQYLLTPVGVPAGEEFRWPYHQHSPELTPDGTVLLFDNGNYRATPGDGRTPMPDEISYSRAVEYRIDEEAMTIEELWSYEYPGARLFSFAMGDANLHESSNTVLLTYGMLPAVGDVPTADLGWGFAQARLVEVARDRDDEVVFDLAVHGTTADGFGAGVYRAVRIAAIR